MQLPDFALEVYFSRWEFVARHNLAASDCETLTVGELLDIAGEPADSALLDVELGYVPTWGGDELRAAIAATYESLDPADVLVFAGAEEALFWALQRLLERGDHAIVTLPNYQSMETIPRATGAAVEGLPLWRGRRGQLDRGADSEWTLDLDRLRSLLRPETRLVAVNFPNNPTGFVPDRDTWRELVQLCDERGVRLLADEVYRGVELDEQTALPQAADLSPRALSVNVMSKAYGLAGLRVGWIACRDARLLTELERAKHYTSICNAAPSERLATLALRHRQPILERNRRLIASNDALVRRFMARHEELFDYRTPAGGCVAFPRYRGAEGTMGFCRRLVEDAGVLLLPSSVYASRLGEVPGDRFRIGIGRRDVPAALAAFERFLEAG